MALGAEEFVKVDGAGEPVDGITFVNGNFISIAFSRAFIPIVLGV